jgi:ADP-heptose:LPS heptosyltransferase
MRLLWVKFFSTFENGIINVFRSILFRKPSVPSRILVFRTGSIGDNICAMPAIVAIRKTFPTAKLHILTNAGGSNLVSLQHLLHESYYDNIIDYLGYSARQLFDVIKKEKYDLVVELPQDQAPLAAQLRNMIFFRFAGIRSGFGWQVNTIFSFRQVQEKKMTFTSERTRLMDVLAKHDIRGDELLFPLRSSADDIRTVDSFFEILPAKKIVALVPGAKRPQNRYPFERFQALASWLVERNYAVLVVGGPEDVERGRQLSVLQGVFDATGKFTPAQSAIALSRCSATISNDTGPMHLSYAAGTPVVGLFSSRDFQEKWFPPKGNVALRNYDIHCSLCFSETCNNNICMQGIPLDKVKDAFLQLEAALQ